VNPKTSGYELVDFGDGRKLERFGDVCLDRPCPAAIGGKTKHDLWDRVAARYEGKDRTGEWIPQAAVARKWRMNLDESDFELRLTDSGQVGVFPEQVSNWQWIRRQLKGRRGARVLNLFAYTGGSTIAAANSGAEVVHVDAARSAVNWARRNAEIGGLGTANIRWIVEDAMKFVRREANRGHAYDGIILDPPSYGHGPKGESWKISRDLIELLQNCKSIMSDSPILFLLSCHTPGFGPAELSSMVCECIFGSCASGVRAKSLALKTINGKKLSSGYTARWP
jgi:23S rRNA (cytosine1962-C5)-methyltransferase